MTNDERRMTNGEWRMTNEIRMPRNEIRKNAEAIRETEDRAQLRFNDLNSKVEGIAGENLRLELVGAIVFFVGIALATWSSEIASLMAK